MLATLPFVNLAYPIFFVYRLILSNPIVSWALGAAPYLPAPQEQISARDADVRRDVYVNY
jgi:hypothetical protein